MRVLIACEYSGTVRDAFRALGHDAWSCDLLPDDNGSPYHCQGDALDVIGTCGPWDLLIAHPPCTYLSSSGLHWNHRRPGRAEKTEQALKFVRALMNAPVPRIAIENPVGCISTRIDATLYGFSTARATQYVQPYDFGEDASKRTGLWLKGLPPLVADPDQRVNGRFVHHNGKSVERWSNQTDSGQNRLPPSADRWKLRSTFWPGVSRAMAQQWGSLGACEKD